MSVRKLQTLPSDSSSDVWRQSGDDTCRHAENDSARIDMGTVAAHGMSTDIEHHIELDTEASTATRREAKDMAKDMAKEPAHYRADVDGLRAVAVVGVILFHMDHSWLPGGFTGVDIFYVISGYVVTSSMLQHRRGSDVAASRRGEARTESHGGRARQNGRPHCHVFVVATSRIALPDCHH